MPTISMFYGIIVMMYYLDNKQHKLPHIHIHYQGVEAVVSIPEGAIMEGSMPSNKKNCCRHGLKFIKKN